jgi:hypothetical protein
MTDFYKHLGQKIKKARTHAINAARLGIGCTPAGVLEHLEEIERSIQQLHRLHLDAVATLANFSVAEICDAPDDQDLGEFSGPAIGRACDRAVEKLARLHGLPLEEIQEAMNDQAHADEGPHGRNE